MQQKTEQQNNRSMNREEKRKMLFLRQKKLLDTFLENKAISQTQYNKSLGDLTVKMGMGEPRDINKL